MSRRDSPPFRMFAVRCSLLAVCLCCLPGCEPDTRITHYKPFLTGISGAEHGTAPVLNNGAATADERPTTGLNPIADSEAGAVTEAEGESSGGRGKLVIENQDGSRTLVLKSVRHLMSNIERCLDEGDEDLLFEQGVARSAKEHFQVDGKDPKKEIITYLQKNRRDIAVLFSRLPFAERTPTAITEGTGRNQFRIRLTGQAKKDLKLDTLWVEFDHGNWKFVWAS